VAECIESIERKTTVKRKNFVPAKKISNTHYLADRYFLQSLTNEVGESILAYIREKFSCPIPNFQTVKPRFQPWVTAFRNKIIRFM